MSEGNKLERVGVLSKNTRKDKENQPDYRGKIMIEGVNYLLSGWKREGSTGPFIKLVATEAESEEML